MSGRPTVLVTGATGLLGPYLLDAFAADGSSPVGTSRSGSDVEADLMVEDDVMRLFERVAPEIVVHAAALADVEACEQDPAVADEVNGMVPERLCRLMSPAASLLLISTDQVYPNKSGPHREQAVGPVNAYGRSKRRGELPVVARGSKGLVLRTNFFGQSRTVGRLSLSDFVVTSLAERRPVTLFEDVLFSPLHMETVAGLVVELAARRASGVLNLGSRDGCSKLEFGRKVANHLGLSQSTASAGRSTDVQGRTARALDLRMDVGRAEDRLGWPLPTIDDEVGKL